MKTLVVLGTRPEAIKLAPLIKELQTRPETGVVLCVTGQHRQMLDQVLGLFDLQPQHDLNLMQEDQRPVDVASAAMISVTRVIEMDRPDIVLVQGDTTTAMAASLAAFLQRIPVGHVEAGLRTGIRTSPFPEEIMRRLVGQMAELHFAPTVRAANNLLRERADVEGAVFLTGNTVVDAVKWISENRARRMSVSGRAKRLVLLTAHRRENFGDPIRSICRAVRTLVDRNEDLEVVYPVHLNPNIQAPVRELLSGHDRIHLRPPLDYEELVFLIQDSYLVMTDSGGIQEEAPAFGKPVLVLRRDTERPEAIEAGTALLVGTDEASIVDAAERLLSNAAEYRRMAQATSPFGDGFAAKRIADILHAWATRDLTSVEPWRWSGSGGLMPYRSAAAVRG